MLAFQIVLWVNVASAIWLARRRRHHSDQYQISRGGSPLGALIDGVDGLQSIYINRVTGDGNGTWNYPFYSQRVLNER